MTEQLLKIAAAYIRVSDERQDEYSPDSQLKIARERAAKEGYQIPDEYVYYDDGISGKNARRRNEFRRMIAIAKEKDHPFDAIYVWKFSRFARNQEESIVYKNLLAKKGVSVISVSEPIPEGPFGKLIERIIEWMDEYYLINLSTEVKRGMTEKASRGEPLGPPPFGYRMQDGCYCPDGEKADIIREIFDRFNSGEGMRTIARDLGARGIRTIRGNPTDNRWVDYVLNNPTYLGKIRWSTDGRAASKRDYHNENLMIVDGNHDPIITEQQWEAAQARIADIKKKYPKYAKREQHVQYMLKGLVRCSACGSTLAMASANKTAKNPSRSLQCCNYSRGSCKVSHSVVMPRIEEAVILGLKEAIGNKTFAISPDRPKQQKPNTPDYDKLIAIEERKLERAKQAFLAEIDTLEQYSENKKEITKQIDNLKALKEKDTSTPSADFNPSAFAEKVSSIIEFIEDDTVSPEAKNEALRTIIDKIVYDKPNSSVAIYFRTE